MTWQRWLSAITLALLLAPTALAQRSDTTVVSASMPRYPGVASLVEDLTLGGSSSAPEYRFTYPLVFAGRGGTLFVIDVHDIYALSSASVRQYDRGGKLMRTLGRNGQGPGEYVGTPGDVKELPDGRILMTDARGVLVFSRDGRPLGQWDAPARSSNRGSRILVDPAGLVFTYGYTRPPGPFRPGKRFEDVPYLYRFRFNGTPLATIAPPEASFTDPSRMELVQIPFIPVYLSAWSPLGYFVTAHTAAYSIDLRKPRPGAAEWHPGDPVVSIRRSAPAVPVQRAERDDWRESLTLFMRAASLNEDWKWSGPEIPDTKPPIRDLYIAPDGRIWVRLSREARLTASVVSNRVRPRGEASDILVDARRRWAEPFLYDVYESTGVYLGQVRMPDDTQRFSADGDAVWIVVYDSDDVPVVKRFRIAWTR